MRKEQSHKSYRPVTVFTFRLNYLLHELAPLGYHLGNVALHALVTLLYHQLAATLLSGAADALAALLFAVHPVHTEAVTGVVGRAELLASIFFLSALVQYGRTAQRRTTVGWRGLMWVAVLASLAMLSKEQGITVLAVCALHEVMVAQRLSLRDWLALGEAALAGKSALPDWVKVSAQRLLILFLTGLALMLARLKIMGATLPVFTRFDNPAAVAETPSRQLTQHYLLSINWWLLLAPADLCCDWTMSTVPLGRSIADPRNLATICLYMLLGHLAYRAITSAPQQEASVISLSLGLLVLPFLPATNLLFPVGFVVAERVLYLPSMGFCLLVAFGCDKLFRRGGAVRSLALAELLATLLVHAGKTVTRNADWRDEYSLFTSGLKVNSGNAKLFNNVGHALESQGKYSEALEYFNQAVRYWSPYKRGSDLQPHGNVRGG